MATHDAFEETRNNLLTETATIHWRELQRFFAAGKALYVSAQLDLIEVATHISQDDADRVRTWMDEKSLAPVSDAQALNWYEEDAVVWAVVVKPWVLVQDNIRHHA